MSCESGRTCGCDSASFWELPSFPSASPALSHTTVVSAMSAADFLQEPLPCTSFCFHARSLEAQGLSPVVALRFASGPDFYTTSLKNCFSGLVSTFPFQGFVFYLSLDIGSWQGRLMCPCVTLLPALCPGTPRIPVVRRCPTWVMETQQHDTISQENTAQRLKSKPDFLFSFEF